MSKKSIFIAIGCFIIIFSSIVVGLFLSMADDTIILTFSSILTNHYSTIKLDKGSTLSLNDYNQTAEGYEFIGWYATPTLENKIEDNFVFTTNKTIYAGFSKIINVNEINSLNNTDIYSYTVVSTGDNEINENQIRKLISLGAKRIDLYNCRIKNKSITTNMFNGTNIKSLVMSPNTEIIEKSAFENCYNLSELQISTSLKIIEKQAFKNCRKLENLFLNDGLLEIQTDAFYGCSKLKKLNIPGSINNLYSNFISNTPNLNEIIVDETNEFYSSKDGILYDIDLTRVIKCPENYNKSLTLPSTVEVIEEYAFYKSKINNIQFNSNIKNINSFAFYGCENLVDIQTGQSTNYVIGDSVFENCLNLKTVTFEKGLHKIGNNVFRNNKSLKSVDIINTTNINFDKLESIGDNLFFGCENLLTFEIPASVKSIGYNMFYNCYKLGQVTIGDNIKTLPNRAFYNCKNIKNIVVNSELNLIGDSVFYNCINLELISNTSFVEYIGNSSFYNCEKLNNLNLSELTSIEKQLFYNCKSLEFLNLSSVKSISNESFYNCVSLRNLILGQNLESIAQNSFINSNNINISISSNDNFILEEGLLLDINKTVIYYCNSNNDLTTINIPATVNSIYNFALSGRDYIENITVDVDSQYFIENNGVLLSKNGYELIAYPSGKKDKNYTIPSSVLKISKYSLQSKNLEEINIGNTVNIIENNALGNLENLKTLTIPFIGIMRNNESSSQKWISSIFGGGTTTQTNTGINNGLYLPANLKNIIVTNETIIPEMAFYMASNIQTISINEDVVDIGNYAFYGCSSLNNIEFKGKIGSIGDYAFKHASNIKKITIGYDASLQLSKNAISSLKNNVSIYIISNNRVDISAKKSYKNKFFVISNNSKQWKWYFPGEGE